MLALGYVDLLLMNTPISAQVFAKVLCPARIAYCTHVHMHGCR